MSVPAAPAGGRRLSWDEVPARIRTAIESLAGGAVVDAATQPGGFSPGLGARLSLDDGRRVFVKALNGAQNPDSPDLHRAEARVTAALPRSAPVPRLLEVYDDGDWVALVYENIVGDHPQLPWVGDELARVVDAIARLHDVLTPCPVPDIGAVVAHPDLFCGWRTLAANAPAPLDDWSRRHLPALAEIESRWVDVADGATLLHLDLRADNMLIRPDGTVVFLDWPHAARGAPLLDVIGFAPSVGMQGGPDLDWIVDRHPATAAADPDDVLVLLTALAGYFTESALRPPPRGLPTVRAFQAAQGAVARRWLADRLGRRGA